MTATSTSTDTTATVPTETAKGPSKVVLIAAGIALAAHFGPLFVSLTALYVAFKVPVSTSRKAAGLALVFMLVTGTVANAVVPVFVFGVFYGPAILLRALVGSRRDGSAARKA